VDEWVEPLDVTLQAVDQIRNNPQEAERQGWKNSESFELNVGRHYDIRAAGRYEMTCVFQNQRSNTVEFEVLPLKRVDATVQRLLERLESFEIGGPGFPYMIYQCQGAGRYDELVCLVRETRSGAERHEFRRISELPRGAVPRMVVDGEYGERVGLVVPHKRHEGVSYIFALDFGKRPIRVEGRQVTHEPGMPPQPMAELPPEPGI
jgi:hypothetical protein